MSDAAPAAPATTVPVKEVKRRLKVTKKSKTAKVAKGSKKTHGKRRSAKNRSNFTSYIYKVLKSVHPNLGISKKGMVVVNDLTNHIYQLLLGEASNLSHFNNKRTISSRDIQTATRMTLKGDLAKHAIQEGTKAVMKYTEAVAKKKKATTSA